MSDTTLREVLEDGLDIVSSDKGRRWTGTVGLCEALGEWAVRASAALADSADDPLPMTSDGQLYQHAIVFGSREEAEAAKEKLKADSGGPEGQITAKMLAKALWETGGRSSSDQPEKFDDLDEQSQLWQCSSAQAVLDVIPADAPEGPSISIDEMRRLHTALLAAEPFIEFEEPDVSAVALRSEILNLAGLLSNRLDEQQTEGT